MVSHGNLKNTGFLGKHKPTKPELSDGELWTEGFASARPDIQSLSL